MNGSYINQKYWTKAQNCKLTCIKPTTRTKACCWWDPCSFNVVLVHLFTLVGKLDFHMNCVFSSNNIRSEFLPYRCQEGLGLVTWLYQENCNHWYSPFRPFGGVYTRNWVQQSIINFILLFVTTFSIHNIWVWIFECMHDPSQTIFSLPDAF